MTKIKSFSSNRTVRQLLNKSLFHQENIQNIQYRRHKVIVINTFQVKGLKQMNISLKNDLNDINVREVRIERL
jgi:hypothetical protein